MNSRGQRREGGFTLIEVVVAFVLLALVLTTAFEIFSTGLARAGQLDDRAQALLIAQSRLAALGQEEAITEGERRGESADRRYQWTITVTRAEEGGEPGKPPPYIHSLMRIDVRVQWKTADARDQEVALSTMALWPRT